MRAAAFVLAVGLLACDVRHRAYEEEFEPGAAAIRAREAEPQPSGVSRPRVAPPFDLALANGLGRSRLPQGEPSVVAFLTTTCEDCARALAGLEAIRSRTKATVIAVSEDDPREARAAPAPQAAGTSFAIARDEQGRTASAWGVQADPEIYVVDARGTIRFVHASWLSEYPDDIVRELKAIQAQ